MTTRWVVQEKWKNSGRPVEGYRLFRVLSGCVLALIMCPDGGWLASDVTKPEDADWGDLVPPVPLVVRAAVGQSSSSPSGGSS